MTKDNYGNDRPDLEPGSTHYSKYQREGDYESASDSDYSSAAEPIDAEIVDDYPDSGAAVGYRGAHRRDDDTAYVEDGAYEDGAYEDALYEEPYEGEPEGRRQAAAAGGAEGGLPKRGLAMILIAVAALLALWGIWKMTQGDGEGEGAAPTSSTVIDTAPAAPADGTGGTAGSVGSEGSPAPAAPADPDGDPNAQVTAAVTDTVRAQDPNAQDPNAQSDQSAANGESAQPAPAPAPAGAPIDAASAQVFVYNNSGVPDLASRTADQLKGQYNVANNSADAAVMNMPEQVYGVFPQTYVFYDPAVPGAEQVAGDIARRVGGATRAKGDMPEGAVSIPEQAANNRAAVAVVLAG